LLRALPSFLAFPFIICKWKMGLNLDKAKAVVGQNIPE
jgi:hypothetical protein